MKSLLRCCGTRERTRRGLEIDHAPVFVWKREVRLNERNGIAGFESWSGSQVLP
mgnify:CR=1 FL=1